ncbi:hypothetical protein DPX16_2048 [Anabarilius grahami]|uniref:Uncharacterized protein n=1 Tax=Anabarilius grahami TaxID=495550 RepID=A0A3N0Y0T4_ANAGA|nr:hypothetical protein DPX16_2048 [Anabarilius grahami]
MTDMLQQLRCVKLRQKFSIIKPAKSIELKSFTQELSEFLNCPYKSNKTERELNRPPRHLRTRLEGGHHQVSGEHLSPIQDTARPRAQPTTTLDCGDFARAPRTWRGTARCDNSASPPLLNACCPLSPLGTSFCDVKPQVMPHLSERILWLYLRPLIPSLHLSPSTCWLCLGSTRDPLPCSSTGFRRPTGCTLVNHHSACAVDLRAFRCTQSLHPYSFSGFLLPSGSASVLSHTGSTSVLGHSGFASSPRLRLGLQVAQVYQLFICTLGSISSFSVGRHTDVVGLVNTLAPPSLNSTVGCCHCLALVCISGHLPSLPPGFHHPATSPLSFPVTIPSPSS